MVGGGRNNDPEPMEVIKEEEENWMQEQIGSDEEDAENHFENVVDVAEKLQELSRLRKENKRLGKFALGGYAGYFERTRLQ